MRLISIQPSTRKDKKWMAEFQEGDLTKTTHFGAKTYEDFTIHKDPKRRELYIKRHGTEDWTDPTTPATLSRYILWEDPDIHKAIAKYRRKFGV